HRLPRHASLRLPVRAQPPQARPRRLAADDRVHASRQPPRILRRRRQPTAPQIQARRIVAVFYLSVASRPPAPTRREVSFPASKSQLPLFEEVGLGGRSSCRGPSGVVRGV